MGTPNLFEAGPDAETRVYSKGNRLLQKGNTQYAWDQDGRLVEKRTVEPQPGLEAPREEVWKYQWNAAGLLQKAARNDGLIVECTYDPFARRLEKKVLQQTSKLLPPKLQSRVRFVWDGDVLVHEIREAGLEKGDPVVEERTYWFEDDGFEPLAHKEKRVDDVGRERGGWFHYLNDPIGTPDKLLAEDGSVATEYERKAWGQLEARSGAKATTPIRLQGQYWDEETGLAYNRWRYYDGEGRFVSADPLQLAGGNNTFRFANSPSFIDPLGLLPKIKFADEELYQPGTGEKNTVRIQMQGTRTRDFTQANKAAGLKETPKDYTWHHVADFDDATGETTMQLVRTCKHKEHAHEGSVAQFQQHFGVAYDTPEAVDAAARSGWLANPRRKRKRK